MSYNNLNDYFNSIFEKAIHYEIPISRILKKLNYREIIDSVDSAKQFLIDIVGLNNINVKYNEDNILVLVGYKLKDIQRTPISSISSRYDEMELEMNILKAEKIKFEKKLKQQKLEHEAELKKIKIAIDISKKANIEIDEYLNKIKEIYSSLITIHDSSPLSAVKIMLVVDTFKSQTADGEKHYKRIIHYPKDQDYSFKDNTPVLTNGFNTWFFGDHFTYLPNPPRNILHLEGGIHENPDLSKL